ncbi:MAG: hypothetical protein U0990_06360 [Candidatus Nanopelagicales bacterium]|nr:hypothetical protein [Candidatus Nanopelagicales bacterium]
MATLEQSLELEMGAALEKGDEVAFVAARNRRQAYWDYRDGVIDLERAKYRMTKMPIGSTARASTVCRNWKGEVEER